MNALETRPTRSEKSVISEYHMAAERHIDYGIRAEEAFCSRNQGRRGILLTPSLSYRMNKKRKERRFPSAGDLNLLYLVHSVSMTSGTLS